MENELDKTILKILKHWHKTEPGWWYGNETLADAIFMETGNTYPDKEVRQSLKRLKKAGLIVTKPIFSDSNGLLNGRGWFYPGD